MTTIRKDKPAELNLDQPWNPYKSDELETFISDLSNKLMQNIMNRPVMHNQPVVQLRQPEEIRSQINMEIDAEPITFDELQSEIDSIIDLSVKTSHPHFFNQLFAQADPIATVGEWVTAVVNASMYTYEVAPALTCMEKDVIKMLESYVGFLEEGKPGGNGIFCPGGSISNLLAMNTARFWKFPQVKEEGMHAVPKIAMFVSELAHYSMLKSAQLMGIGTKNLYEVKCDENGRMLLSDLEEKIEKAKLDGAVPTCVIATAGTTVFGAYDDIQGCSKIARENEMWLHVDGAWGGTVILTSEFSHHMKGIELADSLTWNPHKLMGIPQQCSVMMLHSRHGGLLKDAHGTSASYLFQKDKMNGDLDTGDSTIQCGRRNDVLKLWMMWKMIGRNGMVARVDHVWGISRYLKNQVEKRSDRFVMVNDPMCTNTCFYYIPPCLRNGEHDFTKPYAKWTDEMKEKMDKVAPLIKKMMQERGSMMCTYQKQKQYCNFWRMVIISSSLSTKDMDFVLDEIETCGETLTL